MRWQSAVCKGSPTACASSAGDTGKGLCRLFSWAARLLHWGWDSNTGGICAWVSIQFWLQVTVTSLSAALQACFPCQNANLALQLCLKIKNPPLLRVIKGQKEYKKFTRLVSSLPAVSSRGVAAKTQAQNPKQTASSSVSPGAAGSQLQPALRCPAPSSTPCFSTLPWAAPASFQAVVASSVPFQPDLEAAFLTPESFLFLLSPVLKFPHQLLACLVGTGPAKSPGNKDFSPLVPSGVR